MSKYAFISKTCAIFQYMRLFLKYAFVRFGNSNYDSAVSFGPLKVPGVFRLKIGKYAFICEIRALNTRYSLLNARYGKILQRNIKISPFKMKFKFMFSKLIQ